MILIQHRVNKINQLKKINPKYGIEIDVRTNKSKLILHHDPFKKGPDLGDYLKHYKHKLLVVNIKEEGIETRVLEKLRKKNIKNYFLLDVTVPQLTRIINKEKKIAFRISKYENIKGALKFSNILKWVWIDTFNAEFPISIKEIIKLKKNDFNICLVSPELPMKKTIFINRMKREIHKYINYIDAVCTKNPSIWE